MSQIKTIDEFLFYSPKINENHIDILDEDFQHIVRTLRLKPGSRIQITNGEGIMAWATINELNKKSIGFTNIELTENPRPTYFLDIAIAPTKNISRFEWFVEKAVELGISSITPVISNHSERKHLKIERIRKIMISAMKQSKQPWLPELNPVTKFNELISASFDGKRYIAHLDNTTESLNKLLDKKNKKYQIVIGPEGGFADNEVEKAKQNAYDVVSLASNRLRTETAGLVACHTVKLFFENN